MIVESAPGKTGAAPTIKPTVVKSITPAAHEACVHVERSRLPQEHL